jgi:hypothetical protein
MQPAQQTIHRQASDQQAADQPAADQATMFQFEQDFAGSLRCIPMAVRFKLDRCGVKLSLRQWSHFEAEERSRLLQRACHKPPEVEAYRGELEALIRTRSNQPAEYLPIEAAPPWADASRVPPQLIEFAAGLQVPAPSSVRWATLSPLQRFVLLKLSRAKHDHVNFIPAMREFGLIDR